jgi:hypothetical protein
MKKIMKKIMSVAMAAAIILGGTAVVGANKAAAATSLGCSTFTLTTGLGSDIPTSLCMSKDSSNINASITPGTDQYGFQLGTVYWKMELQKLNSYESYVTFASRTGYVSTASPSHRTFTDVGGFGSYMRLKITFYSNSNFTGVMKTHTSNPFIR